MGKLADALDKAGYGDEDFLRVEEGSVSHEEKPEQPSRQIMEEQFPLTDGVPEEIEIDLSEPSEPEVSVVSPSSSKTIEEKNVAVNKRNNRPHTSLIKPRSAHLAGAWDERLHKAVHSDDHFPEIFKLLRTHILHPADGRPVPKTIMVTAIAPREGKSFITANLGITIAQGMDEHSLLVDCDLRRPRLAGLFGINAAQGLVDYLRDGADLAELLTQTSVNKLTVLPSGKPPVNPSELIDSTRMHNLIDELSSRYDDRTIIFDSPPASFASEVAVLSKRVDGVVLVIRQGGSSKPKIQKFLDNIGRDKILGVVFNAQTSNVLERSLLKGYGYYHQDEDYN